MGHLFWVLPDDSKSTARNTSSSIWCRSNLSKCPGPPISQTIYCCMLRRQNPPRPMSEFRSVSITRSIGKDSRCYGENTAVQRSWGATKVGWWFHLLLLPQEQDKRRTTWIHIHQRNHLVHCKRARLALGSHEIKPFNYSFLYIGFFWDIMRKQVLLPEPKKEKYAKKLTVWSKGAKMNLEDTELMIGTLNHVCLVAPQGRARMPAFYRFRSSFKMSNWHIKHTIAQALHDDVEWWKMTLQQSFVGINIIAPKEPMNLLLMVDTSMSWGIGLVINEKWLAWELKQGWWSEWREIGWAEMVTIELALHTLKAAEYKDCHIILWSDNQGTVGALWAGYLWGPAQNDILCHIVSLMQEEKIWLTVNWIPMKENVADELSRGKFSPKKMLFPHPPRVPVHLKQ